MFFTVLVKIIWVHIYVAFAFGTNAIRFCVYVQNSGKEYFISA